LKPSAKVILPIVVILFAGAVYSAAIWARPAPKLVEPQGIAPMVRVVRADPAPAQLRVRAQGTVEPRTEIDLVSEVAGRIVWVSPELASGGFFDTGDVLVRIDRRDYEVSLEGANASVARAESDLVHANSVLARQQKMGRTGASSRSKLDDAIHDKASAEAGLREARVAVRNAELNLERSEIRAQFAGRVREKHVDVGEFVSRGANLARVYSVDYAEVRLPLNVADLAYLDLPLGFRGSERGEEGEGEPGQGQGARRGPAVVLSAQFAGKKHTWQGVIVRTEGALDARTRMLSVVARVDDPYGREQTSDRPPLPIGLFVDAQIEGRVAEQVFELPRSVLLNRDQVWVVDVEDRLRGRRVDVLRSEGDRTWIRAGIAPGDRVVTSPLDTAVEGMKVRTGQHESGDAAAAAFYGTSVPTT
jgi:multidrug efflux system membrane fusion protein